MTPSAAPRIGGVPLAPPAPAAPPAPPAAWPAILGGAALLGWPAVLNGYPLVFSDTGAFLDQTVLGWAVWDKPVVFGPLLHALHWRLTLWLPLVAQGLVLSWLIWRVQAMLGGIAPAARHPMHPPAARHPMHPPAARHLGLCAGLAAATAAPWFAATLMPDWLAPALVLALIVLGCGDAPGGRLGRVEAWALGLIALIAAAAHLAHLPLAAALVATILIVRRAWRPALRCALPLVGALALLLATNAVFHHRLAVSPFGAVFALARLVADGPAARTIAAACPEAGWHLCAWAGRLPTDSDDFLWTRTGPVWSLDAMAAPPGGPIGLAPEARAILWATLMREPLGVAAAGLRNGAAQLVRARVGDTLGPDHLDASVLRALRAGFAPAEQARFAAGLQAQGRLRDAAAPFLVLHQGALLLGAIGCALLWPATRGDPRRHGLLAAVLVGVAVNALVCGGLSGPHDRYQARIAWLLPLAALLLVAPRHPARAPTRYSRRMRRPTLSVSLALSLALALPLAAALVAPHAAAQDLVGHGGPVRALALPAPGQLASAGFDRTVILWDLPTGRARLVRRWHAEAVAALALLPDGTLASAGEDGRIALWRGDDPTPATVLTTGEVPIGALAAAPDGRLAAGLRDGRVLVWAAGTTDAPAILTGHAGPVTALAWRGGAGGPGLVSAGYDGTLRGWDAGGGTILGEFGLPLLALVASGEGGLVAGGADGSLRLLATDGTLRSLEGGGRPIAALAIAPGGRVLAAATLGGSVGLWALPEGRLLRSLDGPGLPVWSVTFAADGATLWTGGQDRMVRPWSVATGRPRGMVAAAAEPSVPVGADAEGARVWRACSACHALDPSAGPMAGPHLHGLFGRRMGSVAGYPYSTRLAQGDIVWTPETVADLFTRGPDVVTPGTSMPVQRVAEPEALAALLRFLAVATR